MMAWVTLNQTSEVHSEQSLVQNAANGDNDTTMSDVSFTHIEPAAPITKGAKMTRSQKQEVAKEDAVKKCIIQFENAMVLYKDSKYEEAVEIFERLLQEPIITDALRTDNAGEDNLLRRLVFVLCKNTAQIKLLHPVDCNVDDRSTITDSVIDLFITALRVDSSDSEIWVSLGRLYRKKRMFASAIQTLKCGLGPIDFESYQRHYEPAALLCLRELIMTYLIIGDTDNCHYYCLASLKCDPGWEFAKKFIVQNLRASVEGKSVIEKVRVLDEAGIECDKLVDMFLSGHSDSTLSIADELIGFTDFDEVKSNPVESMSTVQTISILDRRLISIVKSFVLRVGDFINNPSAIFEEIRIEVSNDSKFSANNNLISLPVQADANEEVTDENNKDDALRASSRLQKMLGTTDKSQDKKYVLLAGVEDDSSLEGEFDNRFHIEYTERTFEPILGHAAKILSSQDRELCLNVPRRILFVYLKGLLRQSQAAKLRKRQRRDAKPSSNSAVSVSERWNRVVFNEDYAGDIAVEEFINQNATKDCRATTIDFRNNLLSAILKQFAAEGNKYAKDHLSVLFLEIVRMGFSEETKDDDLLQLGNVWNMSGAGEGNELSIQLLEYIVDTLKHFFEDAESAEPYDDGETISSIKKALGLLISAVQVSLQNNINVHVSKLDLRFWFCCAQVEQLLVKASPKFVQFIKRCIKIMSDNPGLSHFEKSNGQIIDLAFLEGELHLMKAKIFLHGINVKITEKRLPQAHFNLLEAIIFEEEVPKDSVIAELPNMSLKNAVSRLSMAKVIDIAKSFLEYHKTCGNAALMSKRRVEIVNKVVADLFKSHRLITLFVDEWKYLNLDDHASFEFGEHYEVAADFMKVLVKILRLIKEISDEDRSGLALIFRSICNMLLFCWDFLHKSTEIRKHIASIHEEYDYFSEIDHIKTSYDVAREFYSCLSVPWLAFCNHQHVNNGDISEMQKSELLFHIHDVLGEHCLCRSHEATLCKLLIENCKHGLGRNACQPDQRKRYEDALFQAFYCQYGIRVTTESMNDLHEHDVFYDSISLSLDEKSAARSYIDLHKYLASRIDRKDTQDTVKILDSKLHADMENLVRENGLVSRNDVYIREYLERDLTPSVSFKVDGCETPVYLHNVVKDESISDIHSTFHMLKGLILMHNALKMPISVETARRQTRIETFISASEAFLADLRISPDRWKSWYFIALCYHAILDEYLSWPPHSIQYYAKNIAQFQKKAFRSLTRAIDILEAKDENSIHNLTNLIVMRSELGYLVYSMVSKPLSGIVCYRYCLSKLELSRHRQAAEANAEGNQKSPLKRKLSEADGNDGDPEDTKLLKDEFEFPKTLDESRKLLIGVEKDCFITFAGACFSTCRKLFKALAYLYRSKHDRNTIESYEWTFMLGKCSEKLKRDPLLALKYYRAAINFSCSDWNLELSTPVTSRVSSPLEPSERINIHFRSICSKDNTASLNSHEEVVPAIFSAFAPWRWTFTQPPPSVSLDPLYKFVSLLMKIYLHYPIDSFAIVEEQVSGLRIGLRNYNIDLWPGYDDSSLPQRSMAMILKLANLITRYDKWYHRMIYRTSWFLRQLIHPMPVLISNEELDSFTTLNDWQAWAINESRLTILQLFQLKTKLTNIWRTAFERSGKYNMYIRDYVALLVDVLGISRDYENLLAFIKRKLKYSDIFWSSDIWAAACDMYSLSFCEEVNSMLQISQLDIDYWWNILQKINKKIVAKCVPILENALLKEMETRKPDDDLQQVRLIDETSTIEELFDLLKRIVEARKLVGSAVFDQYLSKIYSYILIRKAFLESWMSQRYRDHIAGTLHSNSDDQETVVEIDKQLSAFIFWLFEEMKKHGIESEPPITTLRDMLKEIIKTQAQGYLKSSEVSEAVDEWFLVLKSLALSKNQKFFRREKERPNDIDDETGNDDDRLNDIPDANQEAGDEIIRAGTPVADGSSTFGIFLTPRDETQL